MKRNVEFYIENTEHGYYYINIRSTIIFIRLSIRQMISIITECIILMI